jgi:hypothetical protein
MPQEELSSINMRDWQWASILTKLINVLRINLTIVDDRGNVIFLTDDKKFGANMFALHQVGLDWSLNERFIEQFKPFGEYYEFTDSFGLVTFSIPIKDKGVVLYYLLVGPVIINHRLSIDEYAARANKKNISLDTVMDFIHELRIVSHLMTKSILDMLMEVSQIIIRSQQAASNAVVQMQKKNNSSLMSSLLDEALAMTQTHYGSIMIIDEPDTLTVRISKTPSQKDGHFKRRVGEGIAGLAAKNNEVFHITPDTQDNRIKHLLTRPEIKESVIVPITGENGVCGVLSLYTESGKAKIKENINNLQSISRIISAAL